MKSTPVNDLVYLVRDHELEICGVFSSLSAASERFELVLSEIMTSDEFQEYMEHIEDLDWQPCVLVYRVDGGCIWSYEDLDEIGKALKEGEQYDD